MGKAAGFGLVDGDMKSLGTSFGFGHADITVFLAARTDEMTKAYINFNKVWDTLFGPRIQLASATSCLCCKNI